MLAGSETMARTFAAVEIDRDVKPRGWNLVRYSYPETQIIRKLRKGGFYGNFRTLEELEVHCTLLSKSFDVNVKKVTALGHGVENMVEERRQPSLCSKESSSDVKNFQTDKTHELLQSSLQRSCNEDSVNRDLPSTELENDSITKQNLCRDALKVESYHQKAASVFTRVEMPQLPKLHGTIKKKETDPNSSTDFSSPCNLASHRFVVENWYIVDKDRNYVPITDIPYTGLEIPIASNSKEIWLSGQASLEQERIDKKVDEWKLELTVEGRLAIYIRTAGKVWIQLGNPRADYEETVRNLLVCIQLFSMVKMAGEVSKSALMQHLQNDFNHWRVKPNERDLHESLILVKRLNLGATFAIDTIALSAFTTKSGHREESDADSDSIPLSFKRTRRHVSEKLHLRENFTGATIDTAPVGPVPTSNVTSQLQADVDSDDEPLILKRQTKLRKVTPITNEIHHEGNEVLSPDNTEMDHVLLSSRLSDLRRKSSSQTLKKFECDEHKSGAFCRDQLYNRIDMVIQEASQYFDASHKVGIQHRYSSEPLPTIGKLAAIASAASQALDCLDRGGSVEEAETICSKASLKYFLTNELVRSEYGVSQNFPAVSKQREVAERMSYYAQDGDTVVELCSRAIDYFSLLNERLANSGKKCDFRRYRINEPECLVLQGQACGLKDWLSLEKKDLPTGSKLVICLSFSFDPWGEQTNKVLDHALELKPKLIVLIAPCFARRLERETSYDLVWDDSELLHNEVLWPWGLMDVPDPALEKRSGISPIMFLWSRTDWTTKHHQVASRFGHVQKQGHDDKFGASTQIAR